MWDTSPKRILDQMRNGPTKAVPLRCQQSKSARLQFSQQKKPIDIGRVDEVFTRGEVRLIYMGRRRVLRR